MNNYQEILNDLEDMIATLTSLGMKDISPESLREIRQIRSRMEFYEMMDHDDRCFLPEIIKEKLKVIKSQIVNISEIKKGDQS